MPISLGSKAGNELIPRKLAWAPEQHSPPGPHSIAALDLCLHGAPEGSTVGTYEVRHYDQDMYGRAFGPLGLESLLRFCRGLETMLQGLKSRRGALVVSTPGGDDDYRANAAVLVGAYLILRHGWSTTRVASSLGEKDASAAFICSWACLDKPAEEPVLQVRNCWAGIELARQHGWINTGFIKDDTVMETACTKYNEQLNRFDTAWIIPGMLMVGADPTTVVLDPNPATCKRLFPGDAVGKLESLSSTEIISSQASMTRLRTDSTDTICKGYSMHSSCRESIAEEEEATSMEQGDFASFLRHSGISLIVRANFDGELGMLADGYGDNAFEPYGIAQLNVRVVDQNGGLPRPCDIRCLLEECEDYMLHKGTSAIMVHCKGGFGRSVVLACCLAISRWDIPGLALLGWVRVVRPGAITTRLQELFLAQLKGRQDVYRDALLPVPAVEKDRKGSVKVSCSRCHIQ